MVEGAARVEVLLCIGETRASRGEASQLGSLARAARPGGYATPGDPEAREKLRCAGGRAAWRGRPVRDEASQPVLLDSVGRDCPVPTPVSSEMVSFPSVFCDHARTDNLLDLPIELPNRPTARQCLARIELAPLGIPYSQ
jgi:hypothetical protein